MKIIEVVGLDSETIAADNLKNNAQRMKQQATAAQAKLKIKKAQQQLISATKPISSKQN